MRQEEQQQTEVKSIIKIINQGKHRGTDYVSRFRETGLMITTKKQTQGGESELEDNTTTAYTFAMT